MPTFNNGESGASVREKINEAINKVESIETSLVNINAKLDVLLSANILDLFANGEQGAWYDPSDLTTLYQDAAGTTPVTSDGDPVGLMLDKHLGGTFEARRNLFKYTEQIDSSYWVSKSGTFIADDESDPNGNITAEKHVPGTTDNFWRFRGLIDLEAGKSYTASVYVKSSGYNFYQIRFEIGGFASDIYQNFDINAGTIESASSGIVNATIEDAGGGWFRCSATAEAVNSIKKGINFVVINSATAGDLENFVGDGTSGVYVWGVQFEEGSTATDYQPVEEYPTSWPNGNHATQSTAAARPVYRTDGTLHWLEADGVDDILLSPANLDFSDPNYCIAVAAKDTGAGGTNQFFGTDVDTSSGGRRFALQFANSNTIRAFDRTDGDILFDVVADTLITQVYLLNHTSSGKLLRVNKVSYEQVTSTATVSQNSRVSVFSSATSAAYFFGGVVINRELASAEISNTESYLATKSGVTL